MLIEFLMLNKPIFYCERFSSFDNTGIKMNSVMYHFNDEFDFESSKSLLFLENKMTFLCEMQYIICNFAF